MDLNNSCSKSMESEPGRNVCQECAQEDNPKRKRTMFTPGQREILELEFAQNQYPDKFEFEEISNKVKATIDKVKVWYKNRRKKSKQEARPRKKSSLKTDLKTSTSKESNLASSDQHSSEKSLPDCEYIVAENDLYPNKIDLPQNNLLENTIDNNAAHEIYSKNFGGHSTAYPFHEDKNFISNESRPPFLPPQAFPVPGPFPYPCSSNPYYSSSNYLPSLKYSNYFCPPCNVENCAQCIIPPNQFSYDQQNSAASVQDYHGQVLSAPQSNISNKFPEFGNKSYESLESARDIIRSEYYESTEYKMYKQFSEFAQKSYSFSQQQQQLTEYKIHTQFPDQVQNVSPSFSQQQQQTFYTYKALPPISVLRPFSN